MKRLVFAIFLAGAAPALAEGDADKGEAIFARTCASCHSPEAAMQRCMMLTEYQAETRLEGFMPMHRDARPDQIEDLIAYLLKVKAEAQ